MAGSAISCYRHERPARPGESLHVRPRRPTGLIVGQARFLHQILPAHAFFEKIRPRQAINSVTVRCTTGGAPPGRKAGRRRAFRPQLRAIVTTKAAPARRDAARTPTHGGLARRADFQSAGRRISNPPSPPNVAPIGYRPYPGLPTAGFLGTGRTVSRLPVSETASGQAGLLTGGTRTPSSSTSCAAPTPADSATCIHFAPRQRKPVSTRAEDPLCGTGRPSHCPRLGLTPWKRTFVHFLKKMRPSRAINW